MFLLNPKRFPLIPFDPESAGTLHIWYDFDDASTLTVASGTPDVITAVANKAAADTMNDAALDDGITATAGMEQEIARINGRDTGMADDSPLRAMAVRDNTQGFTRVGSAGFRCFFLLETPVNHTDFDIAFISGIKDASGGGFRFDLNTPASGDARWLIQDVTNNSFGVVLNVNNSVNDGNPHVIMLGRSIGTGPAGVDQLVGSIDGVVPTGLPFDMQSGFGDADNPGTTNAVSGWLILGAGGAAPTNAQRHLPASFGEYLLYKTDMTGEQEDSVTDYLAAKWGV